MAEPILAFEIVRCEQELLEASTRIRSIKHADTMVGWITEVLETNEILSKQLHLPTDEGVKNALLTILKSDSQLKHPIVTLLAQRIAAFVATAKDVARHPLCSEHLTALEKNCQLLLGLLGQYQLNYEHRKTVKLIKDALKGQRLHIYKSTSQETDLRVALRAFYEDSNRDDKASVLYVLEFILQQLVQEVRKPGHISQPRHAWWAVHTLFKEGSSNWIKANGTKLNKVIQHLLAKIEYVPSRDMDFTSIVPELHSPENEQIWMAINAIGVYIGSNAQFLTEANSRRMAERIEDSIKTILQDNPHLRDLKYLQSRMMLLYESLYYYGLRFAIGLTKRTVLDLSQKTVGKLYYTSAVVDKATAIKAKVEDLIKNTQNWTRATLSSVLLCGAAGQGKSELGIQLIEEIRRISEKGGKRFLTHVYSIGKDIKNEAELLDCLACLKCKEDAGLVRCVMFDEFDKADFNFCAPFLPHLEEPAKVPVTFWLFAQSKKGTSEELKNYAEGLENKSLRDFLTRLLLGSIDMPHIKFSVEQRICTAIGMVKTQHLTLKGIQPNVITGLAQWPNLTNNRDIRRIVSNELSVVGDVITLKSDKQKSAGLGKRSGKNNTVTTVTLQL